MKPIVCYLDEATGNLYQSNGAEQYIGEVDKTKPVTQVEDLKQEPETNIGELVTLGMSAEDLIKLKHGGVI